MILPPIHPKDATVTRLPTKTKPPPEGVFLVDRPRHKCQHYEGPFEVDEHGGKCKCLACGEEVTAIFVLVRLMRQESRWNQTRLAYQDQMKRLSERSKTKCRHCGEMTAISRA